MTPPFRPGDRFAISPAVRARQVDDELILLDLRRGEYFSLNASGREVWAELTRGAELGAIQTTLSAHWNLPAPEALAFIEGLLRELLDRGLIERSR